MLLKNKLNIKDYDTWEDEYAEKRHETISNLQINTLSELFSDLEEGIVNVLIDFVITAIYGMGEDTDRVFFNEVKYALHHFIIVESDSDEDKECRAKVKAGELYNYKFEGYERSNYSLYCII